MSMCGIVGYIGHREAQDVLLEGLEKLKYRGYDSSGIAILNDNVIQLAKKQGELSNLENCVAKAPFKGEVGIGHTRWATHGKPSDNNAHPHLGPKGKIAIVHNGIIENYQYLKETYLEGHTFKSETDSEVVAHLIEKFYEGDLYSAVQRTLGVITGAYALVVLCADHPDEIIVTRKDSPLVIGLGENENFVASDVPALLSYTRRCIYLESGQMARITADKVVVTDLAGNEKNPIEDYIEWDAQSAEKGGFPHFMIKEIFEQPEAFRRVLSGRIHADHIELDNIVLTKEEVSRWKQVYIVACGTAYHSGLIGKSLLEKALGIPVSVEVASEFRYRDPMLDDSSLIIVISQSGETADTIEALRVAKKCGSKVLAITNVVGSAIAREADMVVYLWAGPEISVASTKAYTSMLLALYLIGLYLGDVAGTINLSEDSSVLRELEGLSEKAEEILQDDNMHKMLKIAQGFVNTENLFYIGRGMDWAVAQEGALKLKEISYIHAEAYAAGELKHGTLALITEETPVIAIALQEKTYGKTMSNIEEVIARNAKVLAIIKASQTLGNDKITQVFRIPDCSDLLAPVLAAIPLQVIAYFTAEQRGCEIDTPRNLAKSVTVE